MQSSAHGSVLGVYMGAYLRVYLGAIPSEKQLLYELRVAHGHFSRCGRAGLLNWNLAGVLLVQVAAMSESLYSMLHNVFLNMLHRTAHCKIESEYAVRWG